MNWRRSTLAALALAGCGRRAAPATGDGGPPGAELAIPAALDDRALAPINVGRAPVDLWPQCERGDVASIDARARNGTFVHGDCAHREHYSFRLVRRDAQVAAELRRRDDGAVVAAIPEVAEISLESVAAAAAAARPPAPLHLEIEGRAAVDVPAATLYDDEEDDGQRMLGGRLGRILSAAGVDPARVATITVHAADGDYVLEPAWLTSRQHDLRIRHNQRGLLRFSHRRDDVEVARRTGVTSLHVRPAP
jgi:hypothetical protein